MATYNKKKIEFIESSMGIEVRVILTKMVSSSTYKTDSSYTPNTSLYPKNQIPFVDKHMDYLASHPATDPQQYLANLRLITRIS